MIEYKFKEIAEIKEKYEKGLLDDIKEDLRKFIIAHRYDIKKFKEEFQRRSSINEVSDEIAIKLYILMTKSINPSRELEDQLKEIHKEIWIQGVLKNRPPDVEEVTKEWAQKYAHGWRAHRTLAIVYVFEQEKQKYLQLLSEV